MGVGIGRRQKESLYRWVVRLQSAGVLNSHGEREGTRVCFDFEALSVSLLYSRDIDGCFNFFLGLFRVGNCFNGFLCSLGIFYVAVFRCQQVHG